jgi:hypothetical protein
LYFGPLLLILFGQNNSRWWFDWNLELQRFGNRMGTYLALLGRPLPGHRRAPVGPPSTTLAGCPARPEPLAPASEVAAGHPSPRRTGLLGLAALVVVIVAWRAILFAGRCLGLFDFVKGVICRHNRVMAQALVLVTDRYPPFHLPK